MSKLWFKAKKYGYGWYPASIEGWIVIGLYVASMLLATLLLEMFLGSSPLVPILFFIWITLETLALIYVSYKKGEPARWRWGDKYE